MNIWRTKIRQITALSKKNIVVYYLKAPVIIFGMLTPFFLFLSFIIGRNLSANEFVPGMIGMVLFFTATSVGPVITPWEARNKTLERLLSCPVTIETILAGDIIASFLFGSFIALTTTVFVLAIFDIGLQHYLAYFLSLLLASFCFSCLGIIMSAVPSDTPSNIMMITTMIKFPLIFISGVFLPLSQLPQWARTVSSISPLTYFTDLARSAFGNSNYYGIFHNLAAMLIFSLVFFVLAMKLHKKTLCKKI
ncbi:MAG: ABC transporter permease [Candidatus Methanofastidiosia archaeon]